MSLRNLLALATLTLGGCVLPAGNTFTRSFTISGGQTVQFNFQKGLVPPENADVKMKIAGIVLNVQYRTIVYTFDFTSKSDRAPRSVVVEDVSGPKPEILVEDDHPVLKNRDWHGASGPKTADDPRLAWLNEPDESFRIYRVTIVTDDGRTVTTYTGANYLPANKEAFKQALGLSGTGAAKSQAGG